MDHPVLDVRNLRVRFITDTQTVMAVDDVSFQVPRGETLAIVGESGSGKSVSCLAAMGLIPKPPGEIVGGEIWFRDRDGEAPFNLLQLSPRQLQRMRGGEIGMIFQEPMSALNPVYTCGDQIIEAIRLHEAVSVTAAKRRTLALLREVQLLPSDEDLAETYRQTWPSRRYGQQPSMQDLHAAIRAHKKRLLSRYPHELSGGQLQRMMIAMALSCDPQLLIADEPTTALDVTVQATILRLLRDLRDRRGMSMIFVSHDLGVVSAVADWIAVMYQGKIVELGAAAQIFNRPTHPYTKGLLACRPQLAHNFTYLPTVSDFMAEEIAGDGTSSLVEKSVDLEVYSQPRDRLIVGKQAPLLQVKYLTVEYPVKGLWGQPKQRFKAVDNVSFDIQAGETLGLVGESGCGKSTLACTLLRLIKPTAGSIMFAGQNIAWSSEKALRKLRRDLQIIFQDPYSALDPRMTIGDTLLEPLLIHSLEQDKRVHRQRIATLLERVGLAAESMNRYPHEFSGGQRQRICIARAIALNPRFIICDESVSALDVSVQAQVLNLLKELQSEFGLTYLFISHDLSVVKFMSDRIIVMNKGRIEEMGTAEEIYRSPQREYTQNLIAAIPQVQTYWESA